MNKVEKQIDYDCHFILDTKFEVEENDTEQILITIERLFNDEVLEQLSHIMFCGIDFDRDSSIEDLDIQNNGHTATVNLQWSGYWTLESIDKDEAKSKANSLLNERLPLFKKFLNQKYPGCIISNAQVTDIVEH